MRRRRKWVRRITRVIATIAIGALLGFLVPTVASDLAPKPEVEPGPRSPPVARQFINAFVADDQAVLTPWAWPRTPSSRQPVQGRVRPGRRPVHLGSYVAGGFSLHAYSSHVVLTNGTEEIRSWRVATAGGQAALITPPNTIEEP